MPRKRNGAAPDAAIKLLVLDVDGVLTDGRLYYGPQGEELKVFHVRDGSGIRALGRAGVELAVISGRNSKMVVKRCRDLDIPHVFQGIEDKVAAFEKLRKKLGFSASECACVGDDTIDVPLLKTVGLAFAVADAHIEARKAAHVVTSLPGGQGAVREICDRLLAARQLAK